MIVSLLPSFVSVLFLSNRRMSRWETLVKSSASWELRALVFSRWLVALYLDGFLNAVAIGTSSSACVWQAAREMQLVLHFEMYAHQIRAYWAVTPAQQIQLWAGRRFAAQNCRRLFLEGNSKEDSILWHLFSNAKKHTSAASIFLKGRITVLQCRGPDAMFRAHEAFETSQSKQKVFFAKVFSWKIWKFPLPNRVPERVADTVAFLRFLIVPNCWEFRVPQK